MKDYWKKLFCALAIIPCTTLAVACNDKPADPSTQSGGTTDSGVNGDTSGGTTGGDTTGGTQLTPEEQQALEKVNAYTTLNTHAKTLNNSSTANFQMVGLSENINSQDLNEAKFKELNADAFEGMGLTTEDQINSLIDTFKPLFNTQSTTKTKGVYGYNGATAEGYSLGYTFVGDDDTGDYVQGRGIYTKKVGNDLCQYTYQASGNSDPDTKMVQYIGDDYAEHEYYHYLQQLSIEDIANNNTLEELINTMSDELINVFANLFGTDATVEDFNLNIDLEKDGSDWKLVCNLSSKEPIEISGEMLGGLSETAQMTVEEDMFIKFNSTGIVSANTSMTSTISMQMEDSGLVFPFEMAMSSNSTTTLEAMDNNVLTNTDFSEYVGTGAGNAIEKVKSRIYYTILQDDETIGQSYTAEQDFGSDITLSTSAQAVAEMDNITGAANAEVTEWYLDRECTKPAGDITKYPSFAMNLYAKATPKANAVQLNTASTDGNDTIVKERTNFVVPTGTTVDLSTYYTDGDFGDCFELEGIYVNGSDTPLTATTLTVDAGEVYDIEFRFKLKSNAITVSYLVYDLATETYEDEEPRIMYVLGTKLTDDDPGLMGDQTTYSVDLASLLNGYPNATLCDYQNEPLTEEPEAVTVGASKDITVVVVYNSASQD